MKLNNSKVLGNRKSHEFESFNKRDEDDDYLGYMKATLYNNFVENDIKVRPGIRKNGVFTKAFIIVFLWPLLLLSFILSSFELGVYLIKEQKFPIKIICIIVNTILLIISMKIFNIKMDYAIITAIILSIIEFLIILKKSKDGIYGLYGVINISSARSTYNHLNVYNYSIWQKLLLPGEDRDHIKRDKNMYNPEKSKMRYDYSRNEKSLFECLNRDPKGYFYSDDAIYGINTTRY